MTTISMEIALAIIPIPQPYLLIAQVTVGLSIVIFGWFWIFGSQDPLQTYENAYFTFTDTAEDNYPNTMASLWIAKAYELSKKDFYRLVDEINKRQPDRNPFAEYEPEFPRKLWYSKFKEARRNGLDLTNPKDAMKFYQMKPHKLLGQKELQEIDKSLSAPKELPPSDSKE